MEENTTTTEFEQRVDDKAREMYLAQSRFPRAWEEVAIVPKRVFLFNAERMVREEIVREEMGLDQKTS